MHPKRGGEGKKPPHPEASTHFSLWFQFAVCIADLKPELPFQAQWKPHDKFLWNLVTASHA